MKSLNISLQVVVWLTVTIEQLLRTYIVAVAWRRKVCGVGFSDGLARPLDSPHSLATAVRFMVSKTPGFGSSLTPITVRAGRDAPIIST